MSEAPLTADEMAEVLLTHADSDGRINVVDAVDILQMHKQAARQAAARTEGA